MKFLDNANARAAMVATIIILLATSILWLGGLCLLFHVEPEFPQFIGIGLYLLTFLGAPGMLVTSLLPIPKGDRSVVAAIVFAWIFYFALCRWLFPHNRNARGELPPQKDLGTAGGAAHRDHVDGGAR